MLIGHVIGMGPGFPANEDVPVLLRSPLLEGRAQVGVSISCDPGTWLKATDHTFAWLRDGVVIAGADQRQYIPVSADADTDLSCRVTAVGLTGSTQAVTAPSRVSATEVVFDRLFFGALTLEGASGEPVSGTSIVSGDPSGHWQITDGRISPSEAGAGQIAGDYDLTLDDGETVAIAVSDGEYSAASVAEIEAAAAAAIGSASATTVRVRSGDYSTQADLDLRGMDFSPAGLTISAYETFGPVLPRVNIEGCANITVERVEIVADFKRSAPGLVMTSGTTDCTIRHCHMHGATRLSDLDFANEMVLSVFSNYNRTSGFPDPVNLSLVGNTIEDVDQGIAVEGKMTVRGNLIRRCKSKFVAFQGSFSGSRIEDNIGVDMYTNGGGRGNVGPNNPNGWSARVSVEDTAGFSAGDTVTLPNHKDASETGRIEAVNGLDLEISGLPSGGEKEHVPGDTITNDTTGATTTITAARSYYPFDYGDPHSAPVGFVSGTDVDDVVERNNIWLPGTDRWQTRGDYHGACPRSGPWDEDNTGLANTNIVRTGNIYALHGGAVENYAIASGAFKWNSAVIDQATDGRKLAYTGGNADFAVGALLTSTSGGRYRITSKSGTTESGTLDLLGLGPVADGDVLTDDAGGSATADGGLKILSGYTAVFARETGPEFEIAHNLIQVSDSGSNDSAIHHLAWNNVGLDETGGAPSTWLDLDGTALTTDTVLDRLTPQPDSPLLPDSAPDVGAVNSYITRATGIGTQDYVPSVDAYPTIGKPVTTVATGIVPNMVGFDGSYMQISNPGADLDGTALTVAFVVEAPTGGASTFVLDSASSDFRIGLSADGILSFEAEGLDSKNNIKVYAGQPLLPEDGPVLFVFTCDFVTGEYHIMRGTNLEGATATAAITNRPGQVMKTDASYMRIGTAYNNEAPTVPLNIGMVWVDDIFVDLLDPAEQSKWVARDGNPVDLGSDGSKPTGVRPAHYFKGPASSIATNRGTGVHGTVIGTMTHASGPGATLPGAFSSDDWSVQTGTGTARIDIAVLALPDDGGASLERLEYRLDGGAWGTLGDTATGTYTIIADSASTAYEVELRAVNAEGAGGASDRKTVTSSAAIAYRQTLFDTQGSAYLQKEASTTPNAATFEFSAWIKPQSVSGAQKIWDVRNGGYIGLSTDRFRLVIDDSVGQTLLSAVSKSGTFTVDTLYHVHVWIDLSGTGVVDVRINGATPSGLATNLEIGTGTGLAKLDSQTGILASRLGGYLSDMHFGDLWIACGQPQIGFQSFYNDGTPPDLHGVGSPFIWLGGAQTAENLNAGENLGSAALTASGPNFTPV